MKRILLKTIKVAAIFMLSISSMAQEKKQLTIEDLVPGGSSVKYADNIYGINWAGDVCVAPYMNEFKKVNLLTGEQEVILTLDEVKEVLKKNNIAGKLTHMYTATMLDADNKTIRFDLGDRIVTLDCKNGIVLGNTEYRKGGQNKEYCEKNGMVAYTINNNLYINNDAITNEVAGIECGKSVHRNEFGIDKGIFWGNSGEKLAFYKMDERMVTEYPLVDTRARIAEVNNIRYPMAGMTSHKVQVGIYDVKTKKTIYLNTGDPTNRYFTNISWSPDDKFLYLIEVNRAQDKAVLCEYDANTGEQTRVIYKEEHSKYVEPNAPILFLPWDKNKFIYQSRRDGFNHLYLFDLSKQNKEPNIVKFKEGKAEEYFKSKQITKGNFLVKKVLGFNDKSKEVALLTLNGIHSANVVVNVETGKVRKGFGFEQAKECALNTRINKSGTHLLEVKTDKNTPREISIIDIKNNKSSKIFSAKNPYEGYMMPSIEVGTIKAADGKTDLYYRMVKPIDFDPNKKYPVVVYVYGGPHAQMINGGWLNGAGGWDIYMATKGYIMFTVDNRGSANRGLEFENVIHRQLGVEECKDQVKGVEYLHSLPYVDKNRIGVHGWSFGGFMTTSLMLKHSDLFKVGVAGGPVLNWEYYEIMYGERYMDSPQENPEGYKENNLLNYAKDLKGRLMIVHDDHDDTCVPQHTLAFMTACINARTYPDLFIYPNHKHNVIGKDRIHLYTKITQYFDDFLFNRK